MSRRTQPRQTPPAPPWTCAVCGEYWHWLNEAGEPVCAACACRREVPFHPWLAHFPEPVRAEVSAIVSHQATQAGVQTPTDVLQRVERFLNGTLVWSLSPHKRQLADAMLDALDSHRAEALEYAATFLTRKEAL